MLTVGDIASMSSQLMPGTYVVSNRMPSDLERSRSSPSIKASGAPLEPGTKTRQSGFASPANACASMALGMKLLNILFTLWYHTTPALMRSLAHVLDAGATQRHTL